MTRPPSRASVELHGIPAATDWILDRLRTLRTAGRARVTLGITGPQGAGKSTLCRALAAAVSAPGTLPGPDDGPMPLQITTIATDDYQPDFALVPVLDRDLPEHADLARLAANLADLRVGKDALAPVWSFEEHRRIAERTVRPADVVICEGLHALNPAIRPLLDLAVLVLAEPAERLARVLARESAERSWPEDEVRRHFASVADPTFARFLADYRRTADLLVWNG